MSRIIIGAVVLVFILLVGLVWVLGSRAKKRLAAQYPPPGQMVDVGGYRMHINCLGDRAEDRTVVMDAGQGEPSLTWASVQPEVERFVSSCHYVRQ